MRIVALVCLLAFAAGCSESEPDVNRQMADDVTPTAAADAVYLDVTKDGVVVSRRNFDLIAEAVCDRDMPDRETESREWNLVADTIGELGGLESFLDARVVVSEIDQNICA